MMKRRREDDPDDKTEDEKVYEAAMTLYMISRSGEGVSRFLPTSRLAAFQDDSVDNNNNNNNNNNVNVNQRRRQGNDEAGGGRRVGMPPVPSIRSVIGRCSPAYEKELTVSDVTEGQGRLTIQKDFVVSYLAPMFNGDEDLKEGIEVTVYNAEGRGFSMVFKLWASKLYVLVKGWKAFYKANNLTNAGEFVTLWMFRHLRTHGLCFVIVPGRRIQPP